MEKCTLEAEQTQTLIWIGLTIQPSEHDTLPGLAAKCFRWIWDWRCAQDYRLGRTHMRGEALNRHKAPYGTKENA